MCIAETFNHVALNDFDYVIGIYAAGSVGIILQNRRAVHR